MAPKYKLTYFNMRGRAEIARLLFVQAGVEYEDCRLTQEEFAAMKGDAKKFPLGQLPVLVIEGHQPLPQSHVIERHLARTFGMYGKDEKQTCLIDVVCETLLDLAAPLTKHYFEKDEVKKAQIMKDFLEKDSVPIFTALSKGLQMNGEGKGYFVGDSMTLADITVFAYTDGLFAKIPEIATMYPVLKEFDARMRAEPKIAPWLSKRPESEF